MKITTTEAFKRLIERIQPSEKDIRTTKRAAKGVRSAIERHLKFNIDRVILIGSQAKNTAVLNQSDVDMIFVLPKSEVRNSGVNANSVILLEQFRNALLSRYPRTRIKKTGQSVALHFSSNGVALDIVPALYKGKKKNANHYVIPNGRGGWTGIAPLVEHRHFKQANDISRRKLGRLLQLIKWWKSCRSSQIQLRSYATELLLTWEALASGANTYSSLLFRSFHILNNRQGRAIQDPKGLVGLTPMVTPRGSREKLCEDLEYAYRNAKEAEKYAYHGNHKRAIAKWQKVFNGNFL